MKYTLRIRGEAFVSMSDNGLAMFYGYGLTRLEFTQSFKYFRENNEIELDEIMEFVPDSNWSDLVCFFIRMNEVGELMFVNNFILKAIGKGESSENHD